MSDARPIPCTADECPLTRFLANQIPHYHSYRVPNGTIHFFTDPGLPASVLRESLPVSCLDTYASSQAERDDHPGAAPDSHPDLHGDTDRGVPVSVPDAHALVSMSRLDSYVGTYTDGRNHRVRFYEDGWHAPRATAPDGGDGADAEEAMRVCETTPLYDASPCAKDDGQHWLVVRESAAARVFILRAQELIRQARDFQSDRAMKHPHAEDYRHALEDLLSLFEEKP
jgi:hypothetical protein